MSPEAVRLARHLARYGEQSLADCARVVALDERSTLALLQAHATCFDRRRGWVGLTDQGRQRATVALLMGTR